jgi:acetyl/propionyl-CoA carboxylase alpha subunit
VRQQIEIAAGGRLSFTQDDVRGRGHAIECRIYAEDPMSGFLPSPGRISFLREPKGPGIRNDCGVYAGFTVPMEYDPILSKLITHASTRDECIARMLRALQDYVILGVLTPIPFLADIIRSEPFARGETYTDFIEAHFTPWNPVLENLDAAALAYVIHAAKGRKRTQAASSEAEEYSPWRALGSFRP